MAAPVGVFVPVLPVYYTTLWVGGAPYYYANDTYYSWNPAQNGYQVVDPRRTGRTGRRRMRRTRRRRQPPTMTCSSTRSTTSPMQQQATDRYECHKWAGLQSGFDPTQQGGAAAAQQPGGNPE